MKLSELLFFLVTFFDKREQLIEYHSQYTQNNNAEHDVIQPENLTAVDNEIAQAGVGRQKFANNDADEAETSMALSLYGDLVHMDLAIDGGGTPLVDPKWKMAPGEASHRWQFYGAEGTFALLEKDDLDYGVIGNPTKATKEKGDKLVEAVLNGRHLKGGPMGGELSYSE